MWIAPGDRQVSDGVNHTDAYGDDVLQRDFLAEEFLPHVQVAGDYFVV